MSFNTFGHMFRVTTWGESHGIAIGATVDGCPPGVALTEADIQPWLDKRKPGQNKFTTQRQEADQVRILSGVYEGRTTGTPIQLMIENTDQRSKDYGDIIQSFRPGHADITYHQKYGLRDPRGGGRSSARETAARVAAGQRIVIVSSGAIALGARRLGLEKGGRANLADAQAAASVTGATRKAAMTKVSTAEILAKVAIDQTIVRLANGLRSGWQSVIKSAKNERYGLFRWRRNNWTTPRIPKDTACWLW